ncbi:glutamate 5-kinase [Escherichia coli]|nr:glutamate 5-kinase [Escherichia coli]KUV33694.1 glutamate 5-kinase [Escherichia coli]KUV55210.1 glutamate 5-kinase [Escherichia coli]KUX49961.1 glutamate 5-kinase [Escherichia coli]KVI14487.1 glutamate 5-kinase [Escherichia coli]
MTVNGNRAVFISQYCINFLRGEVIRICNLEGRDIAHGVSRYNSDALRRIAGHHSQEIDAILGYEYGPVAVHRDDMITR